MGMEILVSDIEVRRAEREGYAAATITIGESDDASHVSLVLDMQDTPHLLSKGLHETLHVEFNPNERT